VRYFRSGVYEFCENGICYDNGIDLHVIRYDTIEKVIFDAWRVVSAGIGRTCKRLTLLPASGPRLWFQDNERFSIGLKSTDQALQVDEILVLVTASISRRMTETLARGGTVPWVRKSVITADKLVLTGGEAIPWTEIRECNVSEGFLTISDRTRKLISCRMKEPNLYPGLAVCRILMQTCNNSPS
jgi:hypothetical protein